MRALVFDLEWDPLTGDLVCMTCCWIVEHEGALTITRPEIYPAWRGASGEAREVLHEALKDPDTIVVSHNVGNDLHKAALQFDLTEEVADAVDGNRVRCTLIRHRLRCIAAPARKAFCKRRGRTVPQRFAFHALKGKLVRVDEGEHARANLAEVVAAMLGEDIAETKKRKKGKRQNATEEDDDIRMGYGKLKGVPIEDWDEKAITYALKDPWYAARAFIAQARPDPAFPPQLWGRTWTDPLAGELDQIGGSLALGAISDRGLLIDQEAVRVKRAAVHAIRDLAATLCELYKVPTLVPIYPKPPRRPPRRRQPGEPPLPKLPKQPKGEPTWVTQEMSLLTRLTGDKPYKRKLIAIAAAVRQTLGELPLTDKQRPRLSNDILSEVALPAVREGEPTKAEQDLALLISPKLVDVASEWVKTPEGIARFRAAIAASRCPAVAALVVAERARKLDTDFLAPLVGVQYAHPGFAPVLDTSRASAFGLIRQNMPRKSGIRECFIPRPGYAFSVVDYSAIELVGLAYVWNMLFRRECSLSKALRQGVDPHLLFAAHRLLGISYEEALRRKGAKDEEVGEKRQASKAANFGFPGGMGARKFQSAKRKEGLHYSLEFCRALHRMYRDQWPEAVAYFAWASAACEADGFMTMVPIDGPGLIRQGCEYTQACNHGFQFTVARGAKYAGWILWKMCYAPPRKGTERGLMKGCYLGMFIHDEYLVEVPLARPGFRPFKPAADYTPAVDEVVIGEGSKREVHDRRAMHFHDLQTRGMRAGMARSLRHMPFGLEGALLYERWMKT